MSGTHLSHEAHDRLAAELEDLRTNGRPRISAEIETARAHGDLRENAEYHAAKEEQGKNEARVRQLKQLLENSQIGAPDAAEDEVAPGKVVTIRFVEFDDEETFLFGSREEAAHASIEVYSPTSPLGSAVEGKKVGESATYELANGKTMSVEILKVETYTG